MNWNAGIGGRPIILNFLWLLAVAPGHHGEMSKANLMKEWKAEDGEAWEGGGRTLTLQRQV